MYIIKENTLYSYWDLIDKHDLEKEANSINDIWIRWHNRNDEKAINRLIKSKKFQKVSHLEFYLESVLKVTNHGAKIIDIDKFEKALNETVVLYRGGSGEYDPNYSNITRGWISFTSSEKRLNTFSVYSGTAAARSFSLAKNKKYWQVELKVKLKDILAYYDVGDNEAIVSVEDAKKAKLIKQV